MKKMITTLTLLTLLVVGAFAQEAVKTDNDFKPGFRNFEGHGDFHGRKDMGRKDHRREGFERGDHRFGPQMIEYLDLTDEQVEKMHKIKIKYDKMEIDLKADQKKLRIDKNEAMKDMDFTKARNVTKAMSESRTKVQLMNIDQKEEMSKILSKEQIEKMKKAHFMRNKSGRKDGKKGKGFKK
ncbi:MAG: Spy/CpxP family protein refolding chaperone [Candidatus Delongbacteria bacterium]|nr:Spy/CpxP family protein refolding chaperone [Candidatus Delongbacteria bacterium]